MSARKHILSIAKDKDIRAIELAKAMKYDHVNSLYRALADPNVITYKKIKLLAKKLDMTISEICEVLK